MRILRIAIRNFRGVEASEVSIPSTGVTLIEGPNEIGKSSLAEAFDLLLEYTHDSKNRRVEAVRPVHRSEGTEVEVELTTGPYHLIYSKRWFHRPETRLQVLAPAPESLIARSAHDRVRAILDDTLDSSLFKALRFVQGERIQQGDVGSSTTLIGALDRAASGGAADPKSESTLWQAIQEEWGRYFTPSGRVSQQREHLAAQLGEAQAQAATSLSSLKEIEASGERYRATMGHLAENQLAQAEARIDLTDYRARSSELGTLALELQTRKADLAEARSREQTASQLVEARTSQAASLKSAEEELERLAGQNGADGLAIQEAETDHVNAVRLLGQAQEELKLAYEALALAEGDTTFRRAEIDHRLLSNRLERIVASRRAEVRAQQFIDQCKATVEGRRLIERALRRRAEAIAAREVSRATVMLEAHSEVDLSVDGEPIHLAAGSEHRTPVLGDVVILLADLLSVHVTGGGTGSELDAKVGDAERGLAELTQRFGLSSADPLAELNEALESRAAADHAIQSARQTRSDALEDLSQEQLEAKVQETRGVTQRYPKARAADPPMPTTLEAAEVVLQATQERMRLANEAMEVRRAAAESSERNLNALRVAASANAALIKSQRERRDAIASTIAAARSQVTDDALSSGHGAAHQDVQKKECVLFEAGARYAASDPEGVAARLENADSLVRRLEAEHLELSRQQVELETTLKVKGSSDLQASLEEAEMRAARLAAEHEGLERRARAAKLLYDTFYRHRDLARQAYVAPYEDQIQRLACLVFGQGTRISVDPDDFSVTTRTVGGITVPFDSLSTGAREQLAVLARLACAILVNPEGNEGDAGVPLILDDALGNSDPARLKLLAPAFASAAGQAQVIIMTSSPDRYRQLGDVNFVHLGPA